MSVHARWRLLTIRGNRPGDPGIDGRLFERRSREGLAPRIREIIDEPGLLDTLRAQAPQVETMAEFTAERVAVCASLASREAARFVRVAKATS